MEREGFFRQRYEETLPPEKREVLDFIADLKAVLAEAKAYEGSPTPEKEDAIRQKVIDLRHRSGLGGLRYPFRVKIAQGVFAETSLGEYMPEETVQEDVVTSLTDIRTDRAQVEFYSDKSKESRVPHWLTVYSYDLEDIEPVFD